MSKPNNTTDSSVVPPGQPGYTQPTTVLVRTVSEQTTPVQTAPMLTAPVHTTKLDISCDKKQTLGLAIGQILCGCVCIVANTDGIVIEQNSDRSFVGYTMCCGVFLFVAGARGITYYKKTRTRLRVVGFLAMTIISWCLCYGMFVWTPVIPSSAECIPILIRNNCYSEPSYSQKFSKMFLSSLWLLFIIVSTFVCWAIFSVREVLVAWKTIEATRINNTAKETGGASPLHAAVELRSAPACVEMSKPNNTTDSSVVPPGQHGYTQPTTVLVQTAPEQTAPVQTAPVHLTELWQRFNRKRFLLGIPINLYAWAMLFFCVDEAVVVNVSIRWTYIYYIGRGVVFIFAGALGIAMNTRSRTRLMVVGLMVMSIISGCLYLGIFVWPHLFLPSADCSRVSDRNCYKEFGRNILTVIVSAAGVILAAINGFNVSCYRCQGVRTVPISMERGQTTIEATRTNNTAQETGGASLLQAEV